MELPFSLLEYGADFGCEGHLDETLDGGLKISISRLNAGFARTSDAVNGCQKSFCPLQKLLMHQIMALYVSNL